MDPRDFLLVAKSLGEGKNPSPAECRTVIGRSYYAALNVASGLMDELNIPRDKSKDAHNDVLDIVAASKDLTLKSACDSLRQRKMVRVHADYRMDSRDVETVRKASMEVALAEKIIRDFDQIRADESRWKIASDNIKVHAKDVLKRAF
jgi:hypothetical protein